jgi:DNA-binding transcriptional ArsR family regulator
MDSLITAAAQRLAAGDPFAALNLIALRGDAAGLALRGIALSQLGDRDRARQLLRAAAKAFGPREAVARARCLVAEAEIALVSRDLSWAAKSLSPAGQVLERHGDLANAAHARYLEIRRLLLTGRLQPARRALAQVPAAVPLPLRVVHELIAAQIALRQLQPVAARAALHRAEVVARHAGIPALAAEVHVALADLDQPAARCIADGDSRLVRLDELVELFGSATLIVDGCRQGLRRGKTQVSLANKPVLLALACALAEAWPGDVSREQLVARAFQMRRADESLRARLRVDIARLRRLLRGLATITATERGFLLAPRRTTRVAVLLPPVEGDHAAVLALLADGEAWSTSAIAQALGSSQRTVQRALDALATDGKVESFGRGRSMRWMTRMALGFTTTLLLPAALPTH